MQQAPQEQHKSGGGFFKTALTAAAGMAGGVMMADSIKGMMGGGQHGSGHGSKTASSEAESEHALHRKPADQASLAGDGNDPGTYDANASEDDGIFDDSGSGGGGSSDE